MSNRNQTQKKNGGCGKAFKVGCLSIFILLAIGGFFAYKSAKIIAVKLVAEYTDATRMGLPAVSATDQEVAEVLERVKIFSTAVKDGKGADQELILSAKDINVLIQKSPAWSSVSGKVYVRIEDDNICGDASIPLDSLGHSFWGTSFLKGRWLNGSASFKVETAAGRLLVFIDSLTVRNKAVPDTFMRGVRAKNLAEEASKNPKTAALIEKLGSISISENKLHIAGK